MNKILKFIAAAGLAVTVSAGALSFAACGGGNEEVYNGTYSGEYSYQNPYGDDRYGVKVSVEVEDNVIKNVVIVNSDYTEASPAMGKWNPELWFENAQSVLVKYRGKTVSEILAITVECDENGEPVASTEQKPVNYDGLIQSGATLSSGRLLKAVQNALNSK